MNGQGRILWRHRFPYVYCKFTVTKDMNKEMNFIHILWLLFFHRSTANIMERVLLTTVTSIDDRVCRMEASLQSTFQNVLSEMRQLMTDTTWYTTWSECKIVQHSLLKLKVLVSLIFMIQLFTKQNNKVSGSDQNTYHSQCLSSFFKSDVS